MLKRNLQKVLVALSLSLLLASCGQKGPLTLPQEEAPQKQQPEKKGN